MNTRLCKEELTRIPVWVKIHDVPIQVFSEDDLSIIPSQIGKPIMLDSYAFTICTESWGRSSFAQCLIEFNADDVLKESLTMGVPLIEGLGFTIETVNIESEWKPPRCDLCKIFGHVHDHCPKKVSISPIVDIPNVETTNDGFQTNRPLKAVAPPTKEGNIIMSNSYAALDDESEEEVENMYDEPANLLNSTKIGESSSTFTVAAG
ncbi:zinc knuckle CX2CX4HX4C containing protein [Tanacetum coccineum]